MQAKVPKFLEIEDKVFLGLSWRQFLELGGASTFIVVGFAILQQPFATMAAILFGVVGVTMAFVKINGRSAHHFIFSLWGYFFNPRRFVWRKEEVRARKPKIEKMVRAPAATPVAMTPEKLKTLATMLDVNQRLRR